MRQTIDQLRQEKAKEAERADKLAEDLKGEFLLVGIIVVVAPRIMDHCNSHRLSSQSQSTIRRAGAGGQGLEGVLRYCSRRN